MCDMESFIDLCHGTDLESAEDIEVNGFEIRGSDKSWCGPGVYFYDIKAKAWWYADITCRHLRQKKKQNVKKAILLADIIDIKKTDIFDLRVKKDLEAFETFLKPLFNADNAFIIDDVKNDTEKLIQLRSAMISFYTHQTGSKLVIGHFMQRPQPANEHACYFANSLGLVFGVETIYCVKDLSIISNIRLRRAKR